MAEIIVIDNVKEDANDVPLYLQVPSDSSRGINLAVDGGHDYPVPEDDAVWVYSPETEGELLASLRRQRRTIPITLQVVEPADAAATNKAVNPSASKDLTGVTSNSLVLMERQTALPAILPGFDSAVHATGNADDDSASWAAAVTNAVAETFSAWVYVVSGTVRLEAWNATPALNASSANITTGSWQRVSLAYTPTTTATYTFRVAQNGAGTCEFYATGIQIGPADPFFDGDTPGCKWTGTRCNSTSIRLAPGGRRFQGILEDLEAKVLELRVYGGTYRRTFPNGSTLTYDVQTARITQEDNGILAELRCVAKVGIELTVKPLARGDKVTV